MYKRLLMLIPIALCMIKCKDRKPVQPKAIGIGLLTVNTNFELPLYEQENDSLAFDVLKFKTGRSGVMRFITKINLKPYQMTGGDSFSEGERNVKMGLIRFSPELKFRVLDTTMTSFKIVTNEKTWETFVVKRNAAAAYYTSEQQVSDNNCSNCTGSNYNPRWYINETWERYLKRVEYITKEHIKVYDQPNGKLIFDNKNNAFLPFRVIGMKGEWIQLGKGFGRESDFGNFSNAEGWTKWRDGSKLTIDITEHTYD